MRVSLEQHVEQFHRAHNHVLEQMGGVDRIMSSGDYMHRVKAAWLHIHGVEIQSERGFHNWHWMVFQDEQHYAFWLLRWS
jgi:hypothetical protein